MAYVPFSQRPEWSDVEPVEQDDGPAPVASINYSPEFRDIMNYFRAVLKRREHSERALKLTEEAVRAASSNYTVWHYRRELLFALNADLQADLDLVGELIEEHPKTYQLWHHRQLLVERMGGSPAELEFCARAIAEDSKNYHAWSYRQWLLRRFGGWEKEREFLDDQLVADVRNNSAWNQRYFLIVHSPLVQADRSAYIRSEYEYALQKMRAAPNNESVWNFIRGLIDLEPSLRDEFHNECQQLRAKGVTSAHLLSALLDHAAHAASQGDAAAADTARKLCDDLASSVDPIRAKYWAYRRSLIQ